MACGKPGCSAISTLRTNTSSVASCGCTKTLYVSTSKCSKNQEVPCGANMPPSTYFYTKAEVQDLIEVGGFPADFAQAISNLLFNELLTEDKSIIGAINENWETIQGKMNADARIEAVSEFAPQLTMLGTLFDDHSQRG